MVFIQLVKKDIQYISSESPDVKAAVAERYNRTLKTRLWKYFTSKQSYRYLEVLQSIVDGINHSYHRTIKQRPVDVTRQNEEEVRQILYGPPSTKAKTKTDLQQKFSVGDKVRIVQHRQIGRAHVLNSSHT